VDEDLQRIEEASAPSVGALSAGAPEATNQKRFENAREREIMVPMSLAIKRFVVGEKAQGISNRSGLSSTSSPLEPDRHYARHSSILRGRRAGWGYRTPLNMSNVKTYTYGIL